MADTLSSSSISLNPQGVGLVLKYPADVAKFNKWVRFDVKAGRHVGRSATGSATLGEWTGKDKTVMSAALYLPVSALRSTMSVGYDTTELSGLLAEAGAQASRELMSAKLGVNLLDKIKGAAGEAASALGALFKGANLETVGEWLKTGAPEKFGTQFEALTGQKVNPRTDILFTAQDYRTWTFEYVLIPRSYAEAWNIQHIVNMFNFYMLPIYRGTNAGLGPKGAYMMGYPYEFEIGIFGSEADVGGGIVGTPLEHANKIGRSVITNLTVDQAGGGKVAFVSDMGVKELFPLVTNMTISFQEVILLGRDQPDIVGGVPTGGDPNA